MVLKTDRAGKRRSSAYVLLLVILALIFPPLAVLLDQGCGEDLCINILLTILGWIPGVIHAFYVLYAKPSHSLIDPVTPATTTTTTVNPSGTTANPSGAAANNPAPAAVDTATPATGATTTTVSTAPTAL